MKNKKKLTSLVSSTVHGIEELLDRVYTLLTNEDYEDGLINHFIHNLLYAKD